MIIGMIEAHSIENRMRLDTAPVSSIACGQAGHPPEPARHRRVVVGSPAARLAASASSVRMALGRRSALEG